MSEKVGIWIDKRTAKIISDNGGWGIKKVIDSNLEEFHPKGGSGTRLKGGPQDVVQDGKYLEREKHQLKDYFKAIAAELKNVDAIVIFGPAETGRKLDQEIRQHHKQYTGSLLGVEKGDGITDNQMVAWVREYFE